MRLIDADKLIDALSVRDCHKYKNPKAYDTLMLYEILGTIEDQPTAYDVDKVIERLHYAKNPYSGVNLVQYNNALDLAMLIVERGGVE